jgi:hypothetical protein
MFNLLKPKEAATATATTTPLPEGMTLEQVRVAMLQLMAEESSNHYRMGQLYNYVVDKRLAEKAGFKDAREYFSQHLADMSQSSLSMYGTVADAFSEPVARRFGVTCLYLLLAYQEAADVEVNHDEPGGTLIEVPQQDGQVQPKTFAACSSEEVRKALQRKRKPSSSKPLPPEAVKRADQYREAVTSRFPKGVLVKVAVRNQKGKAVLDFKGIPVEQVATLIHALTGPLPEVPEEPKAPQAQRVAQVMPRA